MRYRALCNIRGMRYKTVCDIITMTNIISNINTNNSNNNNLKITETYQRLSKWPKVLYSGNNSFLIKPN